MSRQRLTSSVLAIACTISVNAALADGSSGAPKPDGHAPAGVMVDHMHKAGEWMVGYRYNYSENSGDILNGTNAVEDHDIVENACLRPGQTPATPGANTCATAPDRMKMNMHMLDIMYAPTDGVTLMVMPMWMSHDMNMRELEGGGHGGGGHGGGGHGGGGHGGDAHGHGTSGFGDTQFGALVKLLDSPGQKMHAGIMFSAPTGSVDSKNSDGAFNHYHMQIGSGTWDFLPSFTYTGNAGAMSWGAQLSGIIRMEDENSSGYLLGNKFEATAWAGYRLTNWLSASLRVIHTDQDAITGHYNGPHMHASPPDLQRNYGGQYWDIGFGVNMVVPDGALKGHRLSVEWLEPLKDNVNGYQLERDGTLVVNWSKAF